MIFALISSTLISHTHRFLGDFLVAYKSLFLDKIKEPEEDSCSSIQDYDAQSISDCVGLDINDDWIELVMQDEGLYSANPGLVNNW